MSDLKAYAVTETESGEYSGAILFARSNIEARRAGAAEFNDQQLGGMSVLRAKWADRYGSRYAVPARELIDAGWHFECWGCGARLDTDWLYDHHLPCAGVIGRQDGPVYCCARCRRKHLNHERRKRAEERRALEYLKMMVRRRFLNVDFADDEGQYRTHHASVEAGHAGWQWRHVVVVFRFPGMKIAPATLSFDCHRPWVGPPHPEYWCCAGDREAFEAWAAKTRRAAA